MFGIEESFRAAMMDAVRTVVREELGGLRQAQGDSAREGLGDEFLSLKEAAIAAKRSTKTISNWCKSGKLNEYGEGRSVLIKQAELRALMDKRKRATPASDAADLATRLLQRKRA